jgi:hypothetical protein
METFFEDYLNILKRLHCEALQTFQDLPHEALDWSPAPEVNSFSILATHLSGAERYWICDVAGGEPSGRLRAKEFEVHDLDSDMLVDHLHGSLTHAEKILGQLAIMDLDQKRASSMDGRKVTVGWALAHALEHSALHVGHMQILRQWWDHEQEE